MSWPHRDSKGNLCNELDRLHINHKYKDQPVDTVDSILGLLMYSRCVFGDQTLVLSQVDPLLVESASGRIKIVHGRAVIVLNEPSVSKAVVNYFVATDSYLKKEIRQLMQPSTSAQSRGSV